ncbi:MAG TPA: aminomethyltransferase family protein, partial [Steroidobacteraceae bacterium]|nr:aminomethyltransferase family protein [Steroidobacteraceae bacterium]
AAGREGGSLMPGDGEPHVSRPLLRTPFHGRARSLSQLDSFIPRSGYTTVDVFTSVEHEYFAIRNSASLYDLTPLVKYRITGADALRFLNRLTTRDLARLAPGRVAYCVWCNDAGHLIGDGTIFCLGAGEYRLCTAERQLDWLLDSAVGFAVDIEEVTEEVAALALQGPTSCALLMKAGLAGIERLRPFELGWFMLPGAADARLMVSRTGFTGDLGYELWMAPADAGRIWDALLEAGRTRGVRAVGSRALNIARLEAGFLLPHVDFVPAGRTVYAGTERSPFELGLARLVDFGKGHFTGRRALLAEQARDPARLLVALDVDGTKPAHNALLYSARSRRRQVGSVTSAAWSPTTKRNLALAMVEAPHFAMGGALWAEVYLSRELLWERRVVQARVVERPFFAPERRRATPPAEF